MTPLALGVAVSPVPILAVLVVLTTRGAVRNAVLMIVGWVLVLSAMGLWALLIFGEPGLKGITGARGHIDDVANLAVGAVLFGLAATRYVRLRKGDAGGRGIARVFDFCDGMRPTSALLTGMLAVVFNPQNILVTLTSMGLIVASDQGFGLSLLALGIFVVAATSLLALPVIVYLVAPRRSASILASWKQWLLEHNQQVIMYLLVFLGLLLVANGLWGLLA